MSAGYESADAAASAVSGDCWDERVLPLERVREPVPTPERCPDLSGWGGLLVV